LAQSRRTGGRVARRLAWATPRLQALAARVETRVAAAHMEISLD